MIRLKNLREQDNRSAIFVYMMLLFLCHNFVLAHFRYFVLSNRSDVPFLPCSIVLGVFILIQKGLENQV